MENESLITRIIVYLFCGKYDENYMYIFCLA